MWGTGNLVLALGACLGGGALVYAARERDAGQPAPHPLATARPAGLPGCGAGVALAGVLGEAGVL